MFEVVFIFVSAFVHLYCLLRISDLIETNKTRVEEILSLERRLSQTVFELRSLGRELGYRWTRPAEEGWKRESESE